ncbi:MAG TPA: WYL domain-containing protein [Ruminococcus sp.]|nr:WYL domain-containing protein [Ruminococcus sp.]
MSDNQAPMQRLKILYLYKILMEKTDENHPISMPEIIRELQTYGIQAGRKALYEDIEALRAFGLDIVSTRGSQAGYCVVSRSFQLPELKLLADAVASSRFLTEKKAKQLIEKISSLGSPYETGQIKRQIYIANRTKAINERIYLNVDAIHRAITENKKISFRYFKYNVEKKKKYSPDLHICSPYALTWDDERYYLVAHYDKYPDKMTNFRVDRMESVQLLDEPAQKLPKGFSLKEYLSSTFSMFSGTSQDIQLRFENELVSAVIDRFGTDVKLHPDDDNHFTLTVRIKAEQPFFGWLFGFGTRAQIIQPDDVREKYINMLKEVLSNSTK